MYTPEKLKEFEREVVNIFNDGQLKSPVHLSGSKDNIQEEKLIEIFKDIKKEDWVFSTYRSHYHALLKGIPEEWLKNWIKDNKSIHVMNKEHKFFTSAIVAGCLPIAVGTAMAIKREWGYMDVEMNIGKEDTWKPHVWIFIGDMTASLGIFRDCHKYATYHKLPITFVIEDNGLSTDTPTKKVWGKIGNHWFEEFGRSFYDNIIYYKYERTYPHYGTGKFVAKIWDEVKEDIKSKGF